MKKIFTLMAAFVMTMAASAQVVFTDPEGKEYADGETMTIYPEITDEDGFIDVMFHSPHVKNKGTSAANVALKVDMTIPEGSSFMVCYPVNCFNFDASQVFTTDPATVAAGEERDTKAEWYAVYNLDEDKYDYSEGKAVMTAIVNGTPSTTVTVNFIYADPTGINDVTTGINARVAARYGINGQQISANQKGLIIEKMSDGSARKVLK